MNNKPAPPPPTPAGTEAPPVIAWVRSP
jgi:hypothetical protein